MPLARSKIRRFVVLIGLATLIFDLLPFSLGHAEVFQPGKRFFMVTAYYSPLPGQSFYNTGSYEGDIRLNGNGTNGADATEVYAGMLAAPKSYPFGTKILLPGLGVGTVHDRGGAILAGKDYDRIDVWMGEGEAGLARALAFGKRLIEGEIVDFAMPEALDFTWLPTEIPDYVRNRQPQSVTALALNADTSASIRELQEGLRQFGYYHGDITGVIDSSTREAILVFQIDMGIVTSPFDAGAGNFGPRTRAMLKGKLERFNADIEAEKRYLKNTKSLLSPGLGKKAEGDAVASLQKILQTLGYYRGPVDGQYDSKTIDSVFEFQIRHHLISGEWDPGAGYFGVKTHEAVIAALDDRLARLEDLPQEKQMVLPATASWPAPSAVVLGNDTPLFHLNFDLWNKG